MKALFACLLLPVIVQAIQVYLSPSYQLSSTPSTKHAGFILSRHLGLELFETTEGNPEIPYFGEQTFVGRGSSNALLLTMNEEDAQDVIPSSLKQSFSLDSPLHASSLSSLISTFLHRAPHAYSHVFSEASYPVEGIPHLLDIFSIPSAATESFLSEMSTLLGFLETFDERSHKFGAFELKGLDEIAQTYGRSSEQYKIASEAMHAFVQSTLTLDNIHIAVLTYSPSNMVTKREPQQSPFPSQTPAPQQPIGSISTCFPTMETCGNSTNTCSGRGQCVQASKAGRTCFVCACSATQDSEGRTQNWAGEACERKDVSGPFVLLTGTVLGLLIVIVGSISLLYGVGNEQLPGTLTGAVAGGGIKRD